MQPWIGQSLGILVVARTLALNPVAAPAATQGSAPTACSVIDAEQLKRLTSRKDVLKRGPSQSEPDVPAPGKTTCSFLGFIFELNAPAKREWFDDTRTFLTKSGTKTQPVPGVGDAAFYWWDPKPGDTRPVGIVLRVGTSGLMIMDMTSSDSIELVKPELLVAARMVVPKLR